MHITHRYLAVVALSLVVAGCAFTDCPESTDYFGESLPGESPVLFAPHIVSTPRAEHDMAIAPDGSMMIYSELDEKIDTALILTRDCEDYGGWTPPENAPFSGEHSDLEHAFVPGTNELLFVSNRPLPGEDEAGDWNVWTTTFASGRWTEPLPVTGVNSDADEYDPSVALDGSIYLTLGWGDGASSTLDIYRYQRTATGYSEAENLGIDVNSGYDEFSAFVAPDESYILFASTRPGGPGGGDLYVSFRRDGEWQPAVLLGDGINSAALDYSPTVTPDGKYLFFTSRRTESEGGRIPSGGSPQQQEYASRMMNGRDNIYWVDFAVVERLRVDHKSK